MQSKQLNDDMLAGNVVVWGTGSALQTLLRYLPETSITSILDNDSAKWGQVIAGQPVLSPQTFIAEPDQILVIASMYHDAIFSQARNMGFNPGTIFSYQEIRHHYIRQIRNPRMKHFADSGVNPLHLFKQLMVNSASLEYRGVKLGKAMANFYCKLINYLSVPGQLISLDLMPYCLNEYRISPGIDILLMYTTERNDHFELVTRALGVYAESAITMLTKQTHKPEMPCAAKHPYMYDCVNLRQSPWYQRARTCFTHLEFPLNEREIDWLAVKVANLAKLTDFYHEITAGLDIKVFFALLDVLPKEAVMSYVLKARGIPTVVVQHGFYPSPTALNQRAFFYYLKPLADYFMVWGEKSLDAFGALGVSREQQIITGNPKYYGLTQRKEQTEQFIQRREFIVFFNGPGVREYRNYDLIEMAETLSAKHNLSYRIKSHPNTNPAPYTHLLGSGFKGFLERRAAFYDELIKVDFCLLNQSSIVFEAAMLHVPAFVYDAELELHDYMDDCLLPLLISDVEHLSARLDALQDDKVYAEFLQNLANIGEHYFPSDVPERCEQVFERLLKDGM